MSLFSQWQDLTTNQTKSSFKGFWDIYSATEMAIYGDILENPGQLIEGTFSELRERWDAEPIYLMGFLDGVNDSLNKRLELEGVAEDSHLVLDIDLDKLYYNMLGAKAKHLYGLPQWDDVLDEETRKEIVKRHRTAGTVIKEKLPQRNEPCSCGSGKKYKKCCGAAQEND